MPILSDHVEFRITPYNIGVMWLFVWQCETLPHWLMASAGKLAVAEKPCQMTFVVS